MGGSGDKRPHGRGYKMPACGADPAAVPLTRRYFIGSVENMVTRNTWNIIRMLVLMVFALIGAIPVIFLLGSLLFRLWIGTRAESSGISTVAGGISEMIFTAILALLALGIATLILVIIRKNRHFK